jgi:hypothetical protein
MLKSGIAKQKKQETELRMILTGCGNTNCRIHEFGMLKIGFVKWREN